MGQLPSVCVIGAGVSGLTACKALDDFGVTHTCFEASDEARWLSGDWAPPPPEEMEQEIVDDEAFPTGHFIDKPRHTMQLEWYGFQHELKTRSIPAGQARARAGAATGRAAAGRATALSDAALAR